MKGDAEKSTIILGELSLDGTVRKIRGALSVALMAKGKGIKRILPVVFKTGEMNFP